MKKIILFVCVVVLIFGALIFFKDFRKMNLDTEENRTLVHQRNELVKKYKDKMTSIAIKNQQNEELCQWDSYKNRQLEKEKLELYDKIIVELDSYYTFITDDGSKIDNTDYVTILSKMKKINRSNFDNLLKDYWSQNTAIKHFYTLYYKEAQNLNNKDLIEALDKCKSYGEKIKEYDTFTALLHNEIEKLEIVLEIIDSLK